MQNQDNLPARPEGSDAGVKTGLRKQLLAHRQSIAPEVRQRMDESIALRVLDWWQQHRPARLGVYWPVRGEPDLRSIYGELAARGVQLALPTVAGRDAPLVFVAWQPGAPTRRDTYGVQVPESGEVILPEALLIPCVGFNEENFRLGYGGGFYDRTLALRPRPATAGIAYAFSRAEFAAGNHDIALDVILTD